VEGGDEFVEVGDDLRVKDGSMRGARRRREEGKRTNENASADEEVKRSSNGKRLLEVHE
jgi:hypothetical protein